jgi:BED zinc finger
MIDDEAFCFYCQRQYASRANLVRHIRRAHRDTYAYWNIAVTDDAGS